MNKYFSKERGQSHERIYQYLLEDNGGKLYENLRRKKKYQKQLGGNDQRGKIKNQKTSVRAPRSLKKGNDLEILKLI